MRQLLFNAVDPRCSDLFASVGKNQARRQNITSYKPHDTLRAPAFAAPRQPCAGHEQAEPPCTHAIQVTVYDNQHMGGFLGVVVHFTNEATAHTDGGVR